jgi:hypothetical protein
VLTSNGSTWTSAAAPSSAPTTAQVLTATAGASVGAVGTYAFLWDVNAATRSEGTTLAGSNLRYANTSIGATGPGYNSGGTPSGTWRVMGVSGYGGGSPQTSSGLRSSVWLRIS